MTEVKTVKLITEQINELINMLENANIKGANAWKVVQLIKNLKEGLGNEAIDNKD